MLSNTEKPHLKTSINVIFLKFDFGAILSRKKTKFTVFKNPFRFRFQLLFCLFIQKRLIRFVNNLKINGFCRSLMDSSVNFRKPPVRSRNFAQPYSSNEVVNKTAYLSCVL